MPAHNYSLNEIAKQYEKSMLQSVCRMVYMRPNQFSGERITVGVLIDEVESCHIVYISSQDAFEKLSRLYGDEIKEQLVFALQNLRTVVYQHEGSVKYIESPSSLIEIGSTSVVTCGDAKSYARDILEMSSSFFGHYKWTESLNIHVDQAQVRDKLFDSVSRLDVFRAKALFSTRKINIPSLLQKIDVPIYGDYAMGAPISFATQKVSAAKIRAEAYIARFSYAQEFLEKQAALYVLLPNRGCNVNHKLVGDARDELSSIGSFYGVNVHFETTIDRLADAVLEDQHVA